MNKIKIIAIGKIPSEYMNLSAHYTKMLKNKIEIIELTPKVSNIEIEGKMMLEHITDKDYIVLLDIKGHKLCSKAFANKLSQILENHNNITFVIGGAFGIAEKIASKANFSISLSDMTFPHILARIILLEQIYRAFSINSSHPYHK